MTDPDRHLPPKITVAICTLDRPQHLRGVLASLVELDPADAIVEVLVVDNGPHPATEATARSFTEALPSLRYLVEPERGLSRARQRAWRSATGDVIAYLDDDEIVDPGWLRALTEALRRDDGSAGCFGGPVRNAVTGRSLDLGDTEHRLDPGSYVWGNNMAFAVADLVAIDAFSEPLGRTGKRMLGFEEILVQIQIDALGRTRVWVPEMVIDDLAAGHRESRWWGTRYRFWTGVSIARCRRMAPPQASGAGPSLVREASATMASSARALSAALLRRPGRLAMLYAAATQWGALVGRVTPRTIVPKVVTPITTS